jgi:low affinity Fe/Cu permease
MVFLIQNTQNRDAKALHLKLDELIRSTKRARNALIDIEDLTDEEIAELQTEFSHVRKRFLSQKRKRAFQPSFPIRENKTEKRDVSNPNKAEHNNK